MGGGSANCKEEVALQPEFGPWLPQASILIVDDEIEALALMQELFQRNGYETMAAQNGREALAKICCHPVTIPSPSSVAANF